MEVDVDRAIDEVQLHRLPKEHRQISNDPPIVGLNNMSIELSSNSPLKSRPSHVVLLCKVLLLTHAPSCLDSIRIIPASRR
jgi:hypothetical protein